MVSAAVGLLACGSSDRPSRTATPSSTHTSAVTTPTTEGTAPPTREAGPVPDEAAPPSLPPPVPTTAAPQPPDEVSAVLGRLSLVQRVGQLFVTYTYGASATEVTDEQRAANMALYGVGTPAEVVTTYHLGGIILLDRNPLDPQRPRLRTGAVSNPEQIANLTAGLQAAAVADSGVGLLIGADQEGGRVNRIPPPATQFPAPANQGSRGDVRLVEAVAHATGTELAAMGVNQNYAPVADVNVETNNPVIGDRSFGADPSAVADLVTAAVSGYMSAGVVATVKHFPGHGDTLVDSHVGLPVVDHTRQEWEALDRPPFAAAVTAGVPVVMTAHLAMPALDPTGTPATLSAPILGELRDGLGFDGVILSDALGMAGVLEGRTAGDVASKSFLAGADMLLMPSDLRSAISAIHDDVAEGRISVERLDASVQRILRVKKLVGALDERIAAVPDLTVVGSAAHQRLYERALQQAGR